MTMNFVTFNQDDSSLAIGTSRGFRLYHTEPFGKYFSSDESSVAIIEMLFSTSLVALILSPRHLVIQNTKRSATICELTFPSAVLAVRLNRKRLVVILEEEIYLYDIANMTLLHTIATSPNPNAICALSPSSENCYLVLPRPKPLDSTTDVRPQHTPPGQTYVPPTSGDVLIFDAMAMKAVNVVEAHRAPLACIALNKDGTMLATSSETGTIIRVFSLPQGQKLYQFRRGTIPSRIFSMSFNVESTLLCVSSTTDTVHIFCLGPPPSNPSVTSPPTSPSGGRHMSGSSYDSGNESGASGNGSEIGELRTTHPARRVPSGGFGSMIRRTSQIMGKSVAGAVGGYLPQAVTEMWEPLRDFAFIRIPKNTSEVMSNRGPTRSVVAFCSGSPQVMVVTSDGGFYVYSIDMEEGGEGQLVKQYSVLEVADT